MDLRDYEQSKFAIAEILRSAAACAPEQTPALHERIQPLFARLAEDRFNLVVVGRFNRGKTSLMNAILATDRLPTGIVPLTSVITAVCYGSKERAILRFHNSIFDKEISIDELPQYVTQQGNPGNVQHITTAEIQLPAEILRRGFYFVDTPGLGSIIVENTLTTESFLPEADAFVLVTSYESSLSEEEVRFLRAASSSTKRIFVVLNKHDTVSSEERETVLQFVREQLNDLYGSAAPPLFSVSSIDGLAAKRSANQALLEASGIAEFESQLGAFLLSEKREQFLLRMCDRIREVLQELPRSKENATLALQIAALRKQLGSQDHAEPLEPLSAPIAAFPHLNQVQTCEICAKMADELWDFLCKYQYDVGFSRTERQRFADSGGLCPFHAWQLQSVASSYGVCAGYADLLDRLASELRDLASRPTVEDLPKQVHGLIPSEQECALCAARTRAEERAIVTIARQLEERKASALERLSAVCLPHLAILASVLRDVGLIRALLEREAAILQRFSEDMKRYALKHEGRRRYLASAEETTVAERGLLLVTGRRQVNFLPRQPHASDHNHTAFQETIDRS